jgi:putative endonuclease
VIRARLIHFQQQRRPLNVMAGLVPAIHVLLHWADGCGYIYILTNRRDGTLYVGVTNDLLRRVHEHRKGVVPGFTKTHGLKRLVYYEQYDDIRLAIQREKTMKHWPRAWKVKLIHGLNPPWDDLYDSLS